MPDDRGFEYGPILPEEAVALGTMLSQALHFNMNQEGVRRWIERVGHEEFRVVRRHGGMAAGLGIIEMGQWFGGAKVPIVGLSPVGTAAEHRGVGAGTYLMHRMHEEVYERGFPLAVLFPATITFYRRTGYERAGVWNTYELPTDAIDVKDRSLEIVPAEADYDEIYRTYDHRARVTNGHLARAPRLWKRAIEMKDNTACRYLVRQDGRTEGYVTFMQGGQHEPIRIGDLCALTRAAGRRLLTFFADYRSLATSIIWHGGPNDPLLFLLGEQKEKVTGTLDWVVRLVDVEKALALRGYPPGLDAEIHLAVRDEQLRWNDDRFVLQLADGRAEVRRGGEGRLRTDVRTLASLYTGYLTPRELQVSGRLEGAERDLSLAQLAFSGPRPWMPDIF